MIEPLASAPSVCPGCAALLPAEEGATHPYMRCSPACWRRFGAILAREFGDPSYFAVHQITVDTYAVQHPGIPERRAIQSVGLHLVTLCLVLEDGADPREGPQLHKRMVKSPPFEWLDPPPMGDRLNVVDVLPARSPAEHERLVHAWARDVWEAWTAHHDTVRGWIRHSLP